MRNVSTASAVEVVTPYAKHLAFRVSSQSVTVTVCRCLIRASHISTGLTQIHSVWWRKMKKLSERQIHRWSHLPHLLPKAQLRRPPGVREKSFRQPACLTRLNHLRRRGTWEIATSLPAAFLLPRTTRRGSLASRLYQHSPSEPRSFWIASRRTVLSPSCPTTTLLRL